MIKKYSKIISIIVIIQLLFVSCINININDYKETNNNKSNEVVNDSISDDNVLIESEDVFGDVKNDDENFTETFETINEKNYIVKDVSLNFTEKYATYSIINSGSAKLYKQNIKNEDEIYDYFKDIDFQLDNANMKQELINDLVKSYVAHSKITVCVNAGHGTKNGSRVKTFSHPDFTPKYSGGTNNIGDILSQAVSDGMVFDDGTTEKEVNLIIAKKFKYKLLDSGYNVLMIREDDDVQLDNIARTVLANNYADIHIAIHFDSSNTDKGIFYCYPIEVKDYRNMEPLKSNLKNIIELGDTIVKAFESRGEKLFNKGRLSMDLTQLSYSTNPSIDIELGDKKTILTDERYNELVEGLILGINNYCDKK